METTYDDEIFELGAATRDLIVRALRHYATRTDVIPSSGGLPAWQAMVRDEADAISGFDLLARTAK